MLLVLSLHVHCTAAAPAVGPLFGCHGTVLGASVRCGAAGALGFPLSGSLTGKEGPVVLRSTAIILSTPCQVAKNYPYPQGDTVGTLAGNMFWVRRPCYVFHPGIPSFRLPEASPLGSKA